jgi:hypothetical protein
MKASLHIGSATIGRIEIHTDPEEDDGDRWYS